MLYRQLVLFRQPTPLALVTLVTCLALFHTSMTPLSKSPTRQVPETPQHCLHESEQRSSVSQPRVCPPAKHIDVARSIVRSSINYNILFQIGKPPPGTWSIQCLYATACSQANTTPTSDSSLPYLRETISFGPPIRFHIPSPIPKPVSTGVNHPSLVSPIDHIGRPTVSIAHPLSKSMDTIPSLPSLEYARVS